MLGVKGGEAFRRRNAGSEGGEVSEQDFPKIEAEHVAAMAALDARVTDVAAYEPGVNNADLATANARVISAGAWKDVSTAVVVPTRGSIDPRFMACCLNFISGGFPVNQQKTWLMIKGMTCEEAYNHAVQGLLAHGHKWKYLLTIEDDILFPANGLMKLLENMEKGFHIVSGLCWMKGPSGPPMVFGGDPNQEQGGCFPVPPTPDSLQEVKFTPLGFTLIDMDVFRAMKPPYFREGREDDGTPSSGTVDAYFCGKAREAGFRCAVDTRVLLGHLDRETGKVW